MTIIVAAFLLVIYHCTCLHCLDVRLVFGLSGEYSNRGRVEVYHEEEWGTICTDGWDDNDATVVCRMLGYDSGRAFYDGVFSSGRGRIWLSDVRCEGSYWFGSLPSELSECELGEWGENNCTHDMDAGAWCVKENGVILVNGTFNSGRVEVFHDGTYGSICGSRFDDRDADVLCRIAGFKSGGIAYTGAPFGVGNGTIWLSDLQCSGSELRLEDCEHSNWESGSCSHSEDIGVYCYAGKWTLWSPCSATCGPSVRTRRIACVGFDFNPRCRFKSETQDCVNPECLRTKIRLRGSNHGNRGRVEVYHSFRWGSICDDEWGDREATVVCRMLGFLAGKAYIGSYFGGGSGKIWMDDVNCYPSFDGGVPVDIADCSHRGWGRHNCHHNEDAGVWCVRGEDDVVLVNGSSSSGRVEIYHREMFGTICDSNFIDVNADVICSMVGYRGGHWHGNAYFGRGSGVIWMVDVNCSETYSGAAATALSDCHHDGWGIVSCHHGKDVGVQCFNTLDGAWSTWTAWTTCSLTCDTGIHHRIRLCDNPAPRFNGKTCEGIAIEEKNCTTGIHCPVNGGLTAWSAWVDCSATCEFGTHWRSRNCSNPAPKFEGQDCSGRRIEHKRCNVGIRCPINGEWNIWTHWSLCSVTCRSGIKRRSRVCDNPEPQFGGHGCTGNGTQSKICSTSMKCPFDGNWGSWSEWGSCSVSCADGIQQRIRFCDDHVPLGRGEDCTGEHYQRRVCNTSIPCPVHGTRWSEWTSWSLYSETSTVALQERSHDCTGSDDSTESIPDNSGVTSPCPARNNSCTSWEGELFSHAEKFTTVLNGTCMQCYCKNGEHTDCQIIDCKALSMTIDHKYNNSKDVNVIANKGTNITTYLNYNNSENINMTYYHSYNSSEDINMTNYHNYNSSEDINMTHYHNYNSSEDVNMTTYQKYNNSNDVNMIPDHKHNKSEDLNMTTDCRRNISSVAIEPHTTDISANITGIMDARENSTVESINPVTNNSSLERLEMTTENSQTSYSITETTSIFARWSSWTEWTSCSVTCAVGSKTRSRSCLGGVVSSQTGIQCHGKPEEKSVCFTGISCGAVGITWPTKSLMEWSPWSICSSTCKGGVRQRSRACDMLANPTSCDDNNIQKEMCNANVICSDRTRNIVWSTWSDWSACSVTCSIGTKTRTRSCTGEQTGCPGRRQEKAVCFTRVSCGVAGGWGEWSPWSSCAVTCGFGTRGRSRVCTRPSQMGSSLLCKGSDFEISTCTQGGPCRYIGRTTETSWNNWSEWSLCSATCENGTRYRSRDCVTAGDLHSCKGSFNETEECSVATLCPDVRTMIETSWKSWSEWSSCSATCENGTRHRSRDCVTEGHLHSCEGSFNDTEECSVSIPCPVDGSWNAWSQWTPCSVTCGGKEGEKRRFRECNNPSPVHGGFECVGLSIDIQTCNNGIVCSVYEGWSEWSEWTRCSVTCGNGQRTRHRRCSFPVPEGSGRVCHGDHTAVKDCNTDQQCPQTP